MTNAEVKYTKGEIPIFFSTDNNYIPFLDVTIRSLIANASRDYKYHIVVLNTGLDEERTSKIKELEDENFQIDFADISYAVKDIEYKLPNEQHFGLATWYRLFIQSLFPQYEKIIYIDCDLIVEGDISELYNTDLEDNYVAGVVEHWILHSPIFSYYTKEAVGIDSKYYINAGVAVMDLNKFRENQIEQKFVDLINTYNFDVIDPDQSYLNYLCQGKIKYLPFEWNRTPLENVECENPKIIHYALGMKPWHDPKMFLAEHFWKYAETSPFYDEIKAMPEKFTTLARLKKERAGIDIQIKAFEYADGENTFKKKLIDKAFD
ncbi:MAG: glycosyltransferase family 8 protein [Clostridia bacterium]|nr:glycosyltransferase family 8 protein [Clostridia bacterium]